MNYNPDHYHRQWDLIRAVGVFILIVVILSKSWRSYTYSRIIENDDTWDGKDDTYCIQVNHNPFTDRTECKRYGSGDYFFLGTSIFCLVVATLLLVFILKRVCSQIHQSRKQSTRRQECVLEFAVIANSAVSGDCNIFNTTTTGANQNAPTTALEPSLSIPEEPPPPYLPQPPPPAYLPPPAYKDCVINIRDNDK